jgi:hypothetical protein
VSQFYINHSGKSKTQLALQTSYHSFPTNPTNSYLPTALIGHLIDLTPYTHHHCSYPFATEDSSLHAMTTLLKLCLILLLSLCQQQLARGVFQQGASDHGTSVRGGFSVLASSHAPMPGSVYKCSLRLPILGKQEFQLSVHEETKAHLSIAGIMSVDAIIDYNVCSESGAVSFSLPNSVVKMMNKFRTKLLEARYMPDTDSVTIKVQPPLPWHILIELSRL